MTPQQIVGIAIRLFSIWIGLMAPYFFILGCVQISSGEKTQAVTWLGMAAFMLLAAIFLWFFPMTIAHKIVPRTKYENNLNNIQSYQLARAGCGLMGLWWLGANISTVAALFIILSTTGSPGGKFISF